MKEIEKNKEAKFEIHSIENDLLFIYNNTRFFLSDIKKITENAHKESVVWLTNDHTIRLELTESKRQYFLHEYDKWFRDVKKQLVNRWRKADNLALELQEKINAMENK